ncbi:hypothetical protein NE237_012395 [Protea cynaroides]|uniref:Uncharacterized protein n=1 Tax=Protea cynaroides TaxID=273540 RepID=A0A9Q0GWS6_9MAGN|nr:hypothetical protein NE237_012395 [Protea cynaroides]
MYRLQEVSGITVLRCLDEWGFSSDTEHSPTPLCAKKDEKGNAWVRDPASSVAFQDDPSSSPIGGGGCYCRPPPSSSFLVAMAVVVLPFFFFLGRKQVFIFSVINEQELVCAAKPYLIL